MSRRTEAKGRERFLDNDERAALLKACDASDCAPLGAIVRLALATGARRGELLSLQWAGVDLERRTARFLDTKNGESRSVAAGCAGRRCAALLARWAGSCRRGVSSDRLAARRSLASGARGR